MLPLSLYLSPSSSLYRASSYATVTALKDSLNFVEIFTGIVATIPLLIYFSTSYGNLFIFYGLINLEITIPRLVLIFVSFSLTGILENTSVEYFNWFYLVSFIYCYFIFFNFVPLFL